MGSGTQPRTCLFHCKYVSLLTCMHRQRNSFLPFVKCLKGGDRMVSLWNGYKTWVMQNVNAGQEKGGRVLQLNAALSAEEQVAAILRAAGIPVYLRKRVFVAQDNHNREIDVIAVADKVYVIEVKNWSGSVWRNGPRWFQLPTKAQRPLEFEDIFGEAKYKTEALRRHLENDHKISLPKEREDLISCIVFTHPHVKLDPNTVKNLPYVFSTASFMEFVESRYGRSAGPLGMIASAPASIARWAWSWVAPSSSCSLEAETKELIATALGSVRTWDTVTLHNGTFIHGDIVGVECPSAGCSYLRHQVVDLRLQWSAPGAWGLVASLWNGTAGTVIIGLTDAKRKAKKKENKPRNEDGDILFPITIQKGKKDIKQLDRILLKRAGSPMVEAIAISKILTVELSQHRQANPQMAAA